MAELLSAGPPDGRPRLPRWLPVLAVVVALVVIVAVAVSVRSRDPLPDSPTPTEPATASAKFSCPPGPAATVTSASTPTTVVALALPGAVPTGPLDRWDQTADRGPWTVVVRRDGGSIGSHGASVTFPVHESTRGNPVKVGNVIGSSTPGAVVWPIAGRQARIRGDLEDGVLVELAAATRIVADHPVLRPPTGFAVTSQGPHRSRHVREVRYDGSRVDPALGGLVYTGVAEIGGFEDALYAHAVTSCGAVHGQPAVVSSVAGGNGTLAWQLGDTQVGYVGYSGSDLSGPALAAVYRLAELTRPVDEQAWRAAHPQVVSQHNEHG